jgi:hypothetical protein
LIIRGQNCRLGLDGFGGVFAGWDVASPRMLFWQSTRNTLEHERTRDDIGPRVSQVGVSALMNKIYFYMITSLALILWL